MQSFFAAPQSPLHGSIFDPCMLLFSFQIFFSPLASPPCQFRPDQCLKSSCPPLSTGLLGVMKWWSSCALFWPVAHVVWAAVEGLGCCSSMSHGSSTDKVSWDDGIWLGKSGMEIMIPGGALPTPDPPNISSICFASKDRIPPFTSVATMRHWWSPIVKLWVAKYWTGKWKIDTLQKVPLTFKLYIQSKHLQSNIHR